MARFAGVEREYLDKSDNILYSPDAKKFSVLVRRGRVSKNTNEFTLWVYRVADISGLLSGAKTCPSPCAVEAARLQSASNVEAIRQVRWSDDSRTLFFLGESDNGVAQLYRYDPEGDSLAQLTRQAAGIIGYAANSKVTVYSSPVPIELSPEEKLLASAAFIIPDDMSAYELLDPCATEQWYAPRPLATFVQRSGEGEKPIRVSEKPRSIGTSTLRYWLSPDGRRAITLRQPDSIPNEWERYQVHPKFPQYRMKATAAGGAIGGTVWQYELVDLERGAIAPILNAPVGIPYFSRVPFDVTWSPDGNKAILGNTYLPLDGRDEAARKRRELSPAIAVFDMRDSSVSDIAFIGPPGDRTNSVRSFTWDIGGRGVRIVYGRNEDDSSATCYRDDDKQEGGWPPVPCTSLEFPEAAPGSPVISVVEGPNESPKLMARDARSGRSVVLMDPNPEFRSFKFGRAEEIRWKDKIGHEWHGMLVRPPDYDPGRRYPLVLQTHGDSKHLRQFLVDGPASTLFAAQALASRGMVVLQVVDSFPKAGIAKEAPHNMRGYEAAIDLLSKQGVIDRERVGIIGWSRTTWYVGYALTHSKYPFKAAAVGEGIDQGYWQFLMRVGDGSLVEGQAEALAANGGYPFGKGLSGWAEESVGFNADRISAPLLIDVYNPFSAFVQWEMYAVLKSLKKPVEMSVMRDGAHSRIKPMHRLVSQGQSVDWFDFWLNGHEDADPGKVVQYQRWRHLRELQSKQKPISEKTQ